jgi:hypothetical protein
MLPSVAAMAAVSLLACERSPTPVQQAGPEAGYQAAALPGASTFSATMLAGRSIGDLHNESMEAVFHALVRANRSGKLAPRAGCQVARTALMQFFRDRGVLQGASHQGQIDDGLLNAGCGAVQKGDAGKLALSSYAYGSPYEAIANSGLSVTAKDYLYQIHDAVAFGGSTPEIQGQVWSLQQQAAAVLGAQEAEIVAATASVAASSIEYWDASFETWYYANGGGGPIEQQSLEDGEIRIQRGFWDSVKRVAAGDVGGAVAGAVTGSFAGGVGAGPGALAGAAGGSAGVATLELLNMI